MVSYTRKQQKIIEQLLRKFNTNNITYVVCRGHQELPERVPGNDIDILVDDSEYDLIYELAQREGFQKVKKSQLKHIKTTARIAFNNPRQAATKLIKQPSQAAEFVLQKGNRNSSSTVLGGEYNEFQIQKSNVHIHCFNHLAYLSPRKDAKVRVHPSVEEGMLQRREIRSFYYTPSPADELAHLVCRGVFDKKGDFPEYYIRRCNQLNDEVQKSEKQKKILMNLLSEIFFKLDDKVEHLICESEYNNIRSELRASTDY